LGNQINQTKNAGKGDKSAVWGGVGTGWGWEGEGIQDVLGFLGIGGRGGGGKGGGVNNGRNPKRSCSLHRLAEKRGRLKKTDPGR